MYDITGRIIEVFTQKGKLCGEYVSLTWRST